MTATPDLDVPLIDVLEARARRLMAERSRLPEWGDGRRDRRDKLADIDLALDEFNRLNRCEAGA